MVSLPVSKTKHKHKEYFAGAITLTVLSAWVIRYPGGNFLMDRPEVDVNDSV